MYSRGVGVLRQTRAIYIYNTPYPTYGVREEIMVETYIYVTCTKCGRTYSYPNRGYHYNCPYCYREYETCSDGYWEKI